MQIQYVWNLIQINLYYLNTTYSIIILYTFLFLSYRFKPEYVQKEFYTGGHIEVNYIFILII